MAAIEISVAMTTYNGARFLRQQLDSLYRQTRLPDEVVVCDDGSTDETPSILEEYHQRYGLQYHVNEHNLGYNKNFEQAISLTQGRYICLCDQDDVWYEHKIDTLYQAMLRYDKPDEPVVVVGRYDSADADLKITYHPQGHKTEDWRGCIWGETSQGCSLIINQKAKERCLPLPDGLIYDAYIGMTAALTGEWYKVPDALMKYRHHSSNAWASGRSKTLWERIAIKDKFGVLMEDKHIDELRFVVEHNKEHIKPERAKEHQRFLQVVTQEGKLKRIMGCFCFPNKRPYDKFKSVIAIILQ